MKRFWREVSVSAVEGGWQVMLDGRGVKTPARRAQVVPSRALAERLAGEWAAQGEEIDPAGFVLRDMTDYAIDMVAPDPAIAHSAILPYGETDTLCYRAEPGEALARRQEAAWEPLLKAAEARLDVRFERVSGIIHQAQPAATRARLKAAVTALDPFALAALQTLTSLAASLVIGLAALEPDADGVALWDAANLEEDFQAELWGRDAEAEARRARRLPHFTRAMDFVRAARA
ncbi:MAG TPA: ATP12 family protein [Novosphingobium sp.]|nr:ATP12 family protein [Novosphingobium sp.]